VQTAIRFGVFEVDVRAGELRKQGVKVKLQEQPLQVLQILLENPGAVVTREELQQKIWPSDTFVDFDHGLYNAIRRLREALEDSAETPRYVETLARRGYGSRAAMAGIDLPTLKELMGHESISTTMQYVHPTPEHKLRAVLRLETYNAKERRLVSRHRRLA
jgi:DNA-binding winged helix-turn-helix (wHTH) protein